MARDPNRTYQRAPGAGRPRVPDAMILAAINYPRRTGCAWAELPRRFGGAATIHRRYRELLDAGLIDPVPNWRELHPDPLTELAAVVTPEQVAAAQAQGWYNDLFPDNPTPKNRHTP